MPGLAQQIRAKYPGAYDDLSDEQLEQAVRAKYPGAYDDLVSDKREGPSLAGFGRNVGTSALGFASGIADMVLHPIETGKNVGRLALGAAELAIPGEQGHEETARAVGEYFGERYGGLDNIGRTLYEDPVGAAADLSTVLTGGAGALRLAGRGAQVAGAANAANKLKAISGIVSRTAGRVDPLAAAVTNIGKPAARKLYQGALKPTKAVLSKMQLPQEAARAQLIETGLREGIPVSARGLGKAEGVIDDLNAQIAGQIDEVGATGRTIDPTRVARTLDSVANDLGKQVNAQSDLATVENVRGNFLRNHHVEQPIFPARARQVPESMPEAWDMNARQGPMRWQVDAPERAPGPLPVGTAQEIKQGTYRRLKGQYGQKTRAEQAEMMAEKGLARGLKEAIVEEVPEVAALNARESKLIPLAEGVEDALRRTGNRDMVGLANMIGAAGGLMPFLLSLPDRVPGLTSRGAITLYRSADRGGRKLRTITSLSRVNRAASPRTPENDEE